MSPTEKELLTKALERIHARNDAPTYVSDACDDKSLEAGLRSLHHQGYLLGLRDYDTASGGWTWVWDAEKVLAWGKTQQPKYRVVGLRWEITETESSICATAKTRFGHYVAGRYREDYEPAAQWCDWYWEYCFDDHYDEGRSVCDSLEHGKELCEAHWLETLVDGGVIEAVKND